jgi:hypothetical protein
MWFDTLPCPLNILIFQYLDIPDNRRVRSLSDITKFSRLKKNHYSQIVCKSWYGYEKLSRCKYCEGRYILKASHKFICSHCGHNIKSYKYTSTNVLIWNYKLSRTHLMLRLMYNIGGKRNCNYIWNAKQSRWVDKRTPINII